MRVLFCYLDVCTVLGRRIHSYSGVLQANNMGSSDEGPSGEANVRRKAKRRRMIVSNLFDGMVRVEATG